MSDLEKLRQHQDDILRAEIAGWLHNLGKLDPNFLVQQTGESPDILGIYRIFGQYSFRRFTAPSILQSEFPYEHLIGVLYFVALEQRQAIEELKKQIQEIREKLRSKTVSDRTQLGQELQQLTQQRQGAQQALENDENKRWKEYEGKLETLRFTSNSSLNWPLGSLLTLFWESEWFEKPQVDSYEPGTSNDPDYQRSPQSRVLLQNGFSMDMPMLLLLAHGEVSGQEKKGINLAGRYVEVENYHDQNPALDRLRLATAFGYESPFDWKKWPKQRKSLCDWVFNIWKAPAQYRDEFLSAVQYLAEALGDTQRPINEISLWDYSRATAALFKTVITRSIFTNQIPTPADMRWRLAAVRLDAFDFLFQVNQLTDLIARQKLLKKVWGGICYALEVETPIASATYTDEHGLVFVLPELPEQDNKELQQLLDPQISDALAKQSGDDAFGVTDLRPTVYLGPPQRGKKLSLPDVLPKVEPVSTLDPVIIQGYWSNQNQERCIVCQVRPIGYIEPGLPRFVTEEKAKERNLCGICLARRGRRAQEWARNKSAETIWIDEVTDSNGRIALVVGRFDLEDWLDGTLVRSLAIGTDKDGNWLAKPPTFARIQRVWRTTHKFWQEVQQHLNSMLTDDRRRLQIWLDQVPDLGDFHVYELELGKTVLSLVWYPPTDGGIGGYFVSADNLGYTARQLGAEKAIYEDPAAAAIFVEDYIREQFVDGKQNPVLRNPEARGTKQGNLIAGRFITRLQQQDAAYSTAIPILAEPRTFMVLVPADKALNIVQAITTKYEREMGKVRNRLPLYLGVIYFHRRTPLRAALDAGRRMLQQKPLGGDQTWTVQADAALGTLPNEKQALADGTQQFQQTITVQLEQDGHSLTWHVPAVMNDGITPDHWYPYVFVETNGDDSRVNGRALAFKGQRPTAAGPKECWLVHAGELKADDQVYFAPATFDFEWLDTSARRFEIAYDAQGKRYSRPTHPYLLDDLDAIRRAWELIAGPDGLTTSQIHALRDTIETRREAWQASPQEETIHRLCHDAIRNAVWKKRPPAADIESLTKWATSGLLTDVIELYMGIMKEKPKRN